MVEGVPRSGDVKVKEVQRVMASENVNRDACLVQPGEEVHLDQVAISTANESIVEAAVVAEGVSTSVQTYHGSYSALQSWCQIVVQPHECSSSEVGRGCSLGIDPWCC